LCLVVVDAPARLAQRRVVELKNLVDSELAGQAGDPSFFWLTALDQTCPDAVLDQPVWFVGGQEGLHCLFSERTD
jgi:hypothetical protein